MTEVKKGKVLMIKREKKRYNEVILKSRRGEEKRVKRERR